MDLDTAIVKLPWETPATVALTDAQSRADQSDVAMGNGVPGPAPGSVGV